MVSSEFYKKFLPDTWMGKMAARGVERITSNVSYGGDDLIGFYKGRAVSQWAKTVDEALKGILAQCDKIDAK